MEATSEVLDDVEGRVEALRKAALSLLADKVTRFNAIPRPVWIPWYIFSTYINLIGIKR